MDREQSILLTNDDGIDSPGIRALYEGLSTVGTVTVVAPDRDQSAVGRTVSERVVVRDHPLGYAISGTPVDAVLIGIEALELEPDIVVSGCNEGANLGEYVLGRSGTVSAAIESTFLGLPAIAVSLYIPEDRWPIETSVEDYGAAARSTVHLVTEGMAAGIFEVVDFLNVNVPMAGAEPMEMELTEPSQTYEMTVHRDGDGFQVTDGIWEYMDDGEVDDPQGTDRRAVIDGTISVSPLSTPSTNHGHTVLEEIVDRFNRAVATESIDGAGDTSDDSTTTRSG